VVSYSLAMTPRVLKRGKAFDAVKMMRTIRDQTGREIAGMTPPQEIAYIRKKASLLQSKMGSVAHSRRTGRKTSSARRSATRVPRQVRVTWASAHGPGRQAVSCRPSRHCQLALGHWTLGRSAPALTSVPVRICSWRWTWMSVRPWRAWEWENVAP